MNATFFLLAGDWLAVKSALGFSSDWGFFIVLAILASLGYVCYMFIDARLAGDKDPFVNIASFFACLCMFLFVFGIALTYYTKSGDWKHTITVESDSTVTIGGTKYHISNRTKQ